MLGPVRRRPAFRRPALLLVAVSVLVACDGPTPIVTSPSPIRAATARPEVSVTPPALPSSPPPTSGRASTVCVGGWETPNEGTPAYLEPLGIIRRSARVRGTFVIVDMRTFAGPESPPDPGKQYLQDITRWYVKLYVEQDPAFQGRFLVEERRFGRGLSAVAPYDTRGFESPDWLGFQWESNDTERRAYPGIPGTWAGTPYDFAKGQGLNDPALPGEGLNIPGLPAEVAGCLDGS